MSLKILQKFNSFNIIIMMLEGLISLIRKIYQTPNGIIHLHNTRIGSYEKEFVLDALNSNEVSSYGKYLSLFEESLKSFVGADYAVGTVNGTSALHIALLLSGVKPKDEVLTQSFSFVATSNAISYCGAQPVFIDIDEESLGMCPISLKLFLEKNTQNKQGQLINSKTGSQISACLPMHSFGHSCKVDKIKSLCEEFGIPLVEDAAESIGTKYKGKHTGTFGSLGVFSFNGNKTITAGGGGAIVTDDEGLAKKARHLISTAKKLNTWEYIHDALGYNYRMPNLNAALVYGQMKNLDSILIQKQKLACIYKEYFDSSPLTLYTAYALEKPNYWMNIIFAKNSQQRDKIIQYANSHKVEMRPAWKPNHLLTMYQNCQTDSLKTTMHFASLVIQLPSSIIP